MERCEEIGNQEKEGKIIARDFLVERSDGHSFLVTAATTQHKEELAFKNQQAGEKLFDQPLFIVPEPSVPEPEELCPKFQSLSWEELQKSVTEYTPSE